MAKTSGKGIGKWTAKRAANYPTVTPYAWEPTALASKGTTWADWAPYLGVFGVRPAGNYLTATSPALRARMNPLALAAMQNWFATSPRSWSDYLAYSAGFMPRTPALSGRMWAPARWR